MSTTISGLDIQTYGYWYSRVKKLHLALAQHKSPFIISHLSDLAFQDFANTLTLPYSKPNFEFEIIFKKMQHFYLSPNFNNISTDEWLLCRCSKLWITKATDLMRWWKQLMPYMTACACSHWCWKTNVSATWRCGGRYPRLKPVSSSSCLHWMPMIESVRVCLVKQNAVNKPKPCQGNILTLSVPPCLFAIVQQKVQSNKRRLVSKPICAVTCAGLC